MGEATPIAAYRHVVVTPAATALAHVSHAGDACTGDAYNSQLNDRYAGKRDQFRELAQVGIRPAAYRRVSGSRGSRSRARRRRTLQPASGALPDGTYYVSDGVAERGGRRGRALRHRHVITTSRERLSGAARRRRLSR